VVWVFSSSAVSTTARVLNAVALIAFFIPFSYLVDVLMYRVFSKRQQRGSGTG
jgi:preprotein translocase subunit SecE